MTEDKKERVKKLINGLSSHDKKLLKLMIQRELQKRKKK